MKKIILFLLAAILSTGILGCSNGTSKLSFEEMQTQCQAYSYEEIARNPDEINGEYAVISGTISQIREDGKDVVMRINMAESVFQKWEDAIWVEYRYPTGETEKLIAGDVVTVYGVLDGTRTYTTVMGVTSTIPAIVASYVVLDGTSNR